MKKLFILLIAMVLSIISIAQTANEKIVTFTSHETNAAIFVNGKYYGIFPITKNKKKNLGFLMNIGKR